MYRQQTESRRVFTYDEKKKILVKTNNRCAKCGRVVSLKDGSFTVEHIVPISKGGTNEQENLVGLCLDCNQHKDNMIVDPREFYKYIDESYMDEVMTVYKNYQMDEYWLTCRNYFPVDAFLIHAKFSQNSPIDIPMGQVRKMTWDEIDDMVELVTKYNKKFDLDTSGVEHIIRTVMKIGAIYGVFSGKSLIGIVPIQTVMKDIKGNMRYIIEFPGMPCLYQKQKNADMMMYVMMHFIYNLSIISPNGIVGYSVCFPEKDTFMMNLMHRLRPMYEADDGDGFKAYIFMSTLDLGREYLCQGATGTEEKDDKLILKNSRWLQRCMKLKEIKEPKNKPTRK
jgi:hypothetical protein